MIMTSKTSNHLSVYLSLFGTTSPLNDCHHPTIQPSNNPTIQPPNHQTIQPPKHPTIQLFNHPTSQPYNHSTIQLFNHPIIQHSNHPTIQLHMWFNSFFSLFVCYLPRFSCLYSLLLSPSKRLHGHALQQQGVVTPVHHKRGVKSFHSPFSRPACSVRRIFRGSPVPSVGPGVASSRRQHTTDTQTDTQTDTNTPSKPTSLSVMQTSWLQLKAVLSYM